MKIWKQCVLGLVVLLIAAGIWARFFPGAPELLARWGMDWAVAATPPADAAAKPGGNQTGRGPASVIAAPVGTATINDKLQAIGTGRANATVAVTPYSTGRIIEFLVTSGAHIKSGDVIAKLDSDTEAIALERARIARDDAAATLERARTLRKSNATTDVQVTQAELGLRNAELSVHDAEVALERRSVIAPISGIVGILPIEAGNYVTAATTVATIDDRSSILVDFFVPERFAAAVTIGGKIEAALLANAGSHFDGTVSAIDNRVDEKSRTLAVRATIANPADSLRAGMSFEITMHFPGDSYPTVSPLAIQWGPDGPFIWAVDSGKAKSVPVRIIQRNTQTVLIDAELPEGTMVVTAGVQNLRDGDAVQVAGAEDAQQAAAPEPPRS